MKSIGKISALVGFAALLCFAPCALGQGSDHAKLAEARNTTLLNFVPSSFLAYAYGPNESKKHGGCTNRKSENCAAVPEGGAALIYLSLAGLCCLGAMVWRFHRPVEVRQTN